MSDERTSKTVASDIAVLLMARHGERAVIKRSQTSTGSEMVVISFPEQTFNVTITKARS